MSSVNNLPDNSLPNVSSSVPTDPSYYDPTNPQSPYYDPSLVALLSPQNAADDALGSATDNDDSTNNAQAIEKTTRHHRRHLKDAEQALLVLQQQQTNDPEQVKGKGK